MICSGAWRFRLPLASYLSIYGLFPRASSPEICLKAWTCFWDQAIPLSNEAISTDRLHRRRPEGLAPPELPLEALR